MVYIIIISISIFLILSIMYLYYLSCRGTALILKSASRMKTGNDLGEQFEKTIKEFKYPSFIKFYYKLIKYLLFG